MKSILIFIILICSNTIVAQKSLDTIYANDTKNVVLFFPEPIRQGITGKDNFVFTYNREKQQYFGLLQATPGTESNLLTITNDGQVYSYILSYREVLPKLNYFITQNESIGNEKPKPEVVEVKTDSLRAKSNDKTVYYKKFGEYLLKQKYQPPIKTKRKDGIKLQLQRVVYQPNEVYLVIEVKNVSGIDFEIDYLKIYRTNGNKKRKASYQRLEKEVIYKYQFPKVIKNKQSHKFVYVLPKFVLDSKENLEIELVELKGSRKLILNSKN